MEAADEDTNPQYDVPDMEEPQDTARDLEVRDDGHSEEEPFDFIAQEDENLIDEIDSETLTEVLQHLRGRRTCLEIMRSLLNTNSSLNLDPTDLLRRILAVLSHDPISFKKAVIQGTVVWQPSGVKKEERYQPPEPQPQAKKQRSRKRGQPRDEDSDREEFFFESDEDPIVKRKGGGATTKAHARGDRDGTDDGDQSSDILKTACNLCNKTENPEEIILCDGKGCDQPYHIYCLRPELPYMPKGEWRCSICIAEHVPVDFTDYFKNFNNPLSNRNHQSKRHRTSTSKQNVKRKRRSSTIRGQASGSNGDHYPDKKTSREGNGYKSRFFLPFVHFMRTQRDKGVTTLGIGKLYEGIKEHINSESRTPQFSLASFISNHIQSEGDRSIFVRVGKGLYSLNDDPHIPPEIEAQLQAYARGCNLKVNTDKKKEEGREDKKRRSSDGEEGGEGGREGDVDTVEDFHIMATDSPDGSEDMSENTRDDETFDESRGEEGTNDGREDNLDEEDTMDGQENVERGEKEGESVEGQETMDVEGQETMDVEGQETMDVEGQETGVEERKETEKDGGGSEDEMFVMKEGDAPNDRETSNEQEIANEQEITSEQQTSNEQEITSEQEIANEQETSNEQEVKKEEIDKKDGMIEEATVGREEKMEF
ncbi:hypothetical protein PROFUN_00474 [Planoprotostelium fungivorum]|uniref:PHD-type domain-containing protein n=1 Tax=Planoprotostelium fungivorum TaxID=1890364 RepID=A0A2P6N101_9EUKA|nr:hypothetical protein PROFUN_00474 [Planoprotostelium fungivorum]